MPSDSNTAENPVFILLLYVFVIAGWSLACSDDFISAKWKTVKETRRRGCHHFFIIFIPLGYSIAYIFVQSAAKDYKEVGAALVALVLATVHLCRTLWGLWQLHEFKRWAVFSIKSIRTLGVPNKDESLAVDNLADSIIVNDTIVDNSLMEGPMRHAVLFLRSRERSEIKQENSKFWKLYLYINHLVWPVLSLLRLPIIVLQGTINDKNHVYDPYLIPHQREELWLKWAAVFVSDAVPDWLDAVVTRKSFEANIGSFTEARDRFAEEILLSSALHVQNTCKENGDSKMWHAFLPYEEIMKYDRLRRGTLSKAELLQEAAESGQGLPFRVPHRIKEDAKTPSYSRFERKLNKIINSLPADRQNRVKNFTIKELEWLQIFSSVTSWKPSEEIDASHTQSEMLNTSEDHYPILNLALQLGFVEKDGPKRVSEYFRFPLLQHAARSTLWGNRNVLECSLHIDNWIALKSGSYLCDMLANLPKEDSTTLSWKYDDNRNLAYDKNDLTQLFMDSYNNRCDQTLTFLGCSMESLRSLLAKWVLNNEKDQEKAWNPTLKESYKFIEYPTEDFKLCVESLGEDYTSTVLYMRVLWELQSIFHRYLSKSKEGPKSGAAFALCILSFPAVKITNIPVSIGIEEGLSLSYGSKFKLKIVAAGLPRNCSILLTYTGEKLILELTTCENYEVFNWQEWRDSFQGRLAGLRKWQWENGCWNGEHEDGVSNDFPEVMSSHIETGDRFLKTKFPIHEGIHRIKLAHQASLNPYHWAGDCLTVWKGWLPLRRNMCYFELESEGLIKKIQVKHYLAKKKLLYSGRTHNIFNPEFQFLAQSYSTCDRNCLQKCVGIVAAAISDLTDDANTSSDSSYCLGNTLKRMADGLSKANNHSFVVAITLYEIAATYYDDFNALERAVSLLNTSRDYSRVSQIIDWYFYSKLKEMFKNVASGNPKAVENFANSPWLGRFVEIFDACLSNADYDIVIAERYTRCFLVLAKLRGCDYLEKSRQSLRRAFLRISESGLKGSFLLSIELYSNVLNEFKTDSELKLVRMIQTKMKAFAKDLCAGKRNFSNTSEILPHYRLDASHVVNVKDEMEDEEKRNLQYLLYLFFDKVEGLNDLSMELCRQAAEENHPSALYNYAIMLSKGTHGLKQNLKEAEKYYKKSIENGNGSAAFNLARIYQKGGVGMPPNPAKSIEFYEKAMKFGKTKAARNLGNLLSTGDVNVVKDIPRAIQILSKASKEGSRGSTFLLIQILLNRKEPEGFDVDAALTLLRRLFDSMQKNYRIKEADDVKKSLCAAELKLSSVELSDEDISEVCENLEYVRTHLHNVDKCSSTIVDEQTHQNGDSD